MKLSKEDAGVTENPYLSARRHWNDHVGRLVAARTMWQVIGILSLLIALTAVGGALHLASQSKFVPYVVQMDHDGNVQAVQRADVMPAANSQQIEAQIEKFITLSRRVTFDIALQRAAVFGVFSMLAPEDSATAKMSAFYQQDEPMKRAQSETVSTEIKSILPQTNESWQVDWTESVYERNGKLKERFEMRALVQVYQARSGHMTEEALRANPLGVFVRDYSWSRKGEREVQQ